MIALCGRSGPAEISSQGGSQVQSLDEPQRVRRWPVPRRWLVSACRLPSLRRARRCRSAMAANGSGRGQPGDQRVGPRGPEPAHDVSLENGKRGIVPPRMLRPS